MEKPPYKPLLMETVQRNAGSNGYTVVSTFSGGGGSTIGLKLAGFKILYANEFIDAAAETYELNNPGTFVSREDIRTVNAENVYENIGTDTFDVLEGSPPCSAFSAAGWEAPFTLYAHFQWKLYGVFNGGA